MGKVVSRAIGPSQTEAFGSDAHGQHYRLGTALVMRGALLSTVHSRNS